MCHSPEWALDRHSYCPAPVLLVAFAWEEIWFISNLISHQNNPINAWMPPFLINASPFSHCRAKLASSHLVSEKNTKAPAFCLGLCFQCLLNRTQAFQSSPQDHLLLTGEVSVLKTYHLQPVENANEALRLARIDDDLLTKKNGICSWWMG